MVPTLYLGTSLKMLYSEGCSLNLQFSYQILPPKRSTQNSFINCLVHCQCFLYTKTEVHGYTIDSPGAELSPLSRPFIDVPRVITEITTEYKDSFSVSCLNHDQIWMCGRENIMRLYNIKGELMKSIPTKSGVWPKDLAVTGCGDLVDIDHGDSTLNIVKNRDRDSDQVTCICMHTS